MTKFSITNAKLIQKNSLVGSFDLEMPSGLIIRGAMLFEKNGSRWVNFPSKEWTKQDGTKGYYPLLEFASREINDRFQKLVMPFVDDAFVSIPAPAPERQLPKEERSRGQWSGANSGPNDGIGF
jgi:hypothetical protein